MTAMAEYVAKAQVIDWFRPYGHLDKPIPFETLVSDLRGMKSADVEPVQQWIPVYDELPEVGGYVVCIAKRNPFSRFMPMVARIEKNGWVNPITKQYISEVTHWMPIPQPLKGE